MLPPPASCFLGEGGDDRVIDLDIAEAARRCDAGDRAGLPLLDCETSQGVQVDVGDPVAISDHEMLGVDIFAAEGDAATGLGLLAGLREGDGPLVPVGAAQHPDLGLPVPERVSKSQSISDG